jgi:excisionase family DNA binding protein
MSDRDLTPKEVASQLGVTVETVRSKVHNGAFPGAWQDGRIIRIPQAAIAEYRAERVPRGTQPDGTKR